MKRLRVLKLGWEFPPLINGGLGIACLGLSRALAKYVDLRVVVPRIDPAAQFDGFTLTGLNCTRVEDLQKVEGTYRYDSFAQVERIPIHLDPYASDESVQTQSVRTAGGLARFSRTSRDQLALFTPDGTLVDQVSFGPQTANVTVGRWPVLPCSYSLEEFQAPSSDSILKNEPDISLPQRTLSKMKNSGSGPK